MLDYIVLGMIFDEPLTGYDIKKYINAGVGNFYRVSHGNLYPTLKRLTDKKLALLDEQNYGNRVKKYYTASDAGKKEFMDWLATPFDFSLGGSAFLAKIYFFGRLPEESYKKQLAEYEMHYRQSLQKLQEMEKSVLMEEDVTIDYFMKSTLYFGIRNTQNAIEWLSHIIEKKSLPEFIGNKSEEKWYNAKTKKTQQTRTGQIGHCG